MNICRVISGRRSDAVDAAFDGIMRIGFVR